MPRQNRTRHVATRQTEVAPVSTSSRRPASPQKDAGSDRRENIDDLSDREKQDRKTRKSRGAAGRTSVPQTSRTSRRATRAGSQLAQSDATAAPHDHASPDPGPVHVPPQLPLSEDVESSPEMGRRSHTSPRQRRVTDISGLDLDDETFGDLDDSLAASAATKDDDLLLSGQRSTDTSTLDVAAFRKRRRQSSIVGRDDAPIRPPSRGTNTPGISSTFSFGHFRRRQREPSILGVRHRHRSHSRQPYASGEESANERDLTDLMAPSPIRSPSRAAVPSSAQPSSRPASPDLGTRKRKSLESHSGREKRAAVESDDEIRPSIEVAEEDGSDAIASPRRGRSPVRAITPAEDDPDLAPPLSSGSDEDDAAIWPPLESLAHRTYRTRRPPSRVGKTPDVAGAESDVSSPPSLTHSPDYRPARRARKPTKAAAAAKVTSADLASLLPRRRHKHTESNPFDLTLSDESGSDDELSYRRSRSVSRARRPARPLGNASNSRAKERQVPAVQKSVRRTYGSHTSDKENQEAEEEIVVHPDGDDAAEDSESQELPTETSEMMRERLGEELKNAARKFQEVDKWELEFEEDTQSSSPKDAR
ncbi:hypothetical protein VTK73DRAFT_673 [Phialemonium thermophilum]|uniref:Uncharacterized protein n=1 Tax=Phialemonium thermophilum TaxID=223376 RepID=A0ABR3XE71_9PEZI